MRPPWLLATAAESLVRTLRSRRSDICFLQRHLVATLTTWEPLLKAPMVFDVDDAIFVGRRGSTADRIARHAELVICGSPFVQSHFGAFARTALLPTAVDTDRFVPWPTRPCSDQPVLGWSGSSSGFRFLYGIEDALARLMKEHPRVRLKVVADRPPSFRLLDPGRVDFEYWTPQREVEVLREFSVGLMPLPDSDWARGKCSFKMLTYMAVGVPVVVSPVGMNNDVLAHGPSGFAAGRSAEWVEAIDALLADAGLRESMGRTGREVVERHYARKVVAPRLAELLEGVS